MRSPSPPWIQAIEFARHSFLGKGFDIMELTIRPYDSALITTLKKFMERVAAKLTIGANDCNPVFSNSASGFYTNCGRMNTTAIVDALREWGNDPAFKYALADETWADEMREPYDGSISPELFLMKRNPLIPMICPGRYCRAERELKLVDKMTDVQHHSWSNTNIIQCCLAICMLLMLLSTNAKHRNCGQRDPLRSLAILALLATFVGCLINASFGDDQTPYIQRDSLSLGI